MPGRRPIVVGKVSLEGIGRAGYRYQFVDYRPSNRSAYNVVTSGAVLGVTWNIK